MQKVLIAEKDPVTREHYARLVRGLGHEPLECHDGISVLDCATANPDVALILMDLDLPGAWGEQLVDVLRRLDHLAHVPIIVVSAPRTRTQLMRLLVLGMHQWFEKPPAVEELAEAIQAALDRVAALDLFEVEDQLPVGAGAHGGSWLLHA
ncbi:MAG: response regulator [Planctomycetota bacterium]